jgi:ADP-heptose:LPS heptosyltransferase
VRDALVPGVERIAVLRANRVGDLLFALPALDALKAAYPAAELVLLGCRWHTAFLPGRPGPVDRVIAVPSTPGVNDLDGPPVGEDEREAFLAAMRAEGFDLALQLHGGGRYSNPFVGGLGARVTAGARSEDAAPLDRWVRYVYWQNEVARYLELVALVGAEPVGLEPRLRLTAADRAEAARVLPAAGPLAVLCPGASDGRRRWPPAAFAAVGDALAARGLPVAVTGSAGEAELVAAVTGAMARPALDLGGRVSLGGLAAVLERADLVVSNDSGPMHVAGAVGTPVVGIFWGGNLVTGGPPFRARMRPVASWRTACPVCGADCMTSGCDHDASFVADVPVGEVLAAAEDLLAVAHEQRAPAGAAA